VQVREIIAQGGRCLIPVVALGRAQELLLILEDCWSRHPELRHVPIYQTSGIATQSLGVYQSYIEMMNDSMRAVFKQRNPFEFKHVRHTRGFRADSEIGPCVVLATPSMLQTGLSRELFESWCEDARNGVIIADFAVQVLPCYPTASCTSTACKPYMWRMLGAEWMCPVSPLCHWMHLCCNTHASVSCVSGALQLCTHMPARVAACTLATCTM
jgi:hypothetical protein